MEDFRENQRFLIGGVRKVIWVFDAFIIATLSMVGVSLMIWIVYEFYLVLIGQLPLERGGLSILGSVLIVPIPIVIYSTMGTGFAGRGTIDSSTSQFFGLTYSQKE